MSVEEFDSAVRVTLDARGAELAELATVAAAAAGVKEASSALTDHIEKLCNE